MCGFGGILNSSNNLDNAAVAEIARLVSHRGPDSTGIRTFNHSFDPVREQVVHAVFFNRLAILDLDARSNQPFENDRYLLLFNGEIYNYKALRKELEQQAVIFTTSSDTEVLFRGLEHWNKEFLKKLNGMFAFFWLDKKERKFILARDRVGIKPIYYRVEGGTFSFASELYSLVRFSKTSPEISETAVLNYLSLQYTATPNTILKNVSKLPPGYYLDGSIDKRTNIRVESIESYWDGYSYILNQKDAAEFSNLEEVLSASVQRQSHADVPLGMFLSSGVDSSLLTAIINKHSKGRPFDFFTVSFDEETSSDESSAAARYLRGFGNPQLRHHKLTVNSTLLARKLESFYDFFDEPFGDHAALLNLVISEKARERVTVVLSGDGADELFWGYPRYSQWNQELGRPYKRIPGLYHAETIVHTLPESRTKYTLLAMLETDPVHLYFNILRPRLFGSLPPVTTNKDLWCLKDLDKLRHRNDLPAIMDLKGYLPDAMLYKVDRASMAVGLEVRVPFLDNEVINYALRMPLDYKSTSEFQHKAPLKNLLVKLAPHYDAHQPKKGFNFPLRHWLHTHWKEVVMDLTTKRNLEDLGLPPNLFLDIVNNFYQRNANATTEVWYLFNLLLWHDKIKKFSHKA